MSDWYSLYFTPSFTLSLLVEAERPGPSPLISVLSACHTLSRSVLGRPSVLLESLDEELEKRPLLSGDDTEEDGLVIGAGALRVVDHNYWAAQVSKPGLESQVPRQSDDV